jgi:tetratricopeptide (TPR) repeat protein
VMLFKVNFSQNLLEALYNIALAQIAQDAIEDADRTLDLLLKQAPHVYQPWLRKAELLLARHNWTEATDHFLKGISLAPVAERPALYISTAGALYNKGQHALAIRVYRTALTERRTPEIVCFLAWILATSTDDTLRNGKEALELAQEAQRVDPNSPIVLNTLAGAFAEVGRFREAIEACDRAIANARVRGETAATQVFQQRLEILKTGKPLRN